MKLPVRYDSIHYTKRKFVRNEYIKQQGGKCHYCKHSLKQMPPLEILQYPVAPHLFPKGFFDWPVHLHHSHDTGMTIGAVHAYCNAILWQYHGE